jgi:uncharacterized protein with HEPN domain
MNNDRFRLTHILEFIRRVEEYLSRDDSDFFSDTMVQDAVIRNLQILAESTLRLSTQLKAQYDEVDWRSIAGFRNVVVHDFLDVDLLVIWGVIQRDLPHLNPQVLSMLADLEDQQ